MSDQRFSDNDVSRRDVPSFIEPLPPLISNPFMRPRPQKATNLLKLFEEDSECEEPELVQVYLRLKPCSIPSNLYEVRSDRCLITSWDTTTAGHGRRTQHNVSKMYTFSHIFRPRASQKEIFENVVKENLRKLPNGHSFTLLTYGASGSGKTFTLMGTVASPGLVPRSLEYVFRVVDAAQQPLYKPSEGGADKLNNIEQEYELKWVNRLRHISAPLRDKYRRMSAQLCNDMTASTIDLSNRTRYYVWVSFVEIYNESIYDLLAPGDKRNASKLLIREDSNGTVYVKGATQAFVRTGEEAYDVMVAGKHNLQVAATGVHAQSSRSHCIFTITMLTHTEDGVRISCVRLCDLAGCERARRTRNTGARMQESRAINSSLHVLERCLHTLRRKQRATKHALVPYRESKLTRLLGAGLSGARGEAVSMVVTLNPSPEYAHETRHVLQLAAVARDIQINNTMSEYPSTLETSQDSTLDGGIELMKLRADNERLHFELIQAQTRNKELIASMEERQASTADTMRSLVEEAREITRTYYEAQIQALRNEMEEMTEEYESRLSKVVLPPKVETPNRSLQNKVTQLMTEIAILEEQLSAEQLARARAEEEVQHLRACIEERDENAAGNNEEVISLTDSDNENDSDTEDDPCNESLEPTFAKEDINRSRLIIQSIISDEYNNSHNEDSVSSAEKLDISVLEKSTDTIKEDEINESINKNCNILLTESNITKTSNNIRESCNVMDTKDDKKDPNNINQLELAHKGSGTLVSKIINSLKSTTNNNSSLAQFEQLEKATRDWKSDYKEEQQEEFCNINLLKEKRAYFDDSKKEYQAEMSKPLEQKSYFDNIGTNIEKGVSKILTEVRNEVKGGDDLRSPSIVKEDITNDFEPSTIKRLLGESITRQPEPVTDVKIKNVNIKKHDSFDVFESPLAVTAIVKQTKNIKKLRDSMENLVIKSETDNSIPVINVEHLPVNDDNADEVKLQRGCKEKPYVKEQKPVLKSPKNLKSTQPKTDSMNVTEHKNDNTYDEFENIYNHITAPRATEFELLISQEVTESQVNETVAQEALSGKEVKYDLRHNSQSNNKTNTKDMNEMKVGKANNFNEDVLLEKCESKQSTRRNLKLRRRKNMTEDECKEEEREITEREKLKDIINLQSEFSDVTIDVPAPVKELKDISSPEKVETEVENIPLTMGIQSCPSKTVTRSRRKLFTPRAEPLQESVQGVSGERIAVPRPSYHRPRARRKL